MSGLRGRHFFRTNFIQEYVNIACLIHNSKKKSHFRGGGRFFKIEKLHIGYVTRYIACLGTVHYVWGGGRGRKFCSRNTFLVESR